jgi:hypothetical protein
MLQLPRDDPMGPRISDTEPTAGRPKSVIFLTSGWSTECARRAAHNCTIRGLVGRAGSDALDPKFCNEG